MLQITTFRKIKRDRADVPSGLSHEDNLLMELISFMSLS